MTAHAPQTNQQTQYPSGIIDSDELFEEYSIKRINASIFGAYLRTFPRLVVSLHIYIYRFLAYFIHPFNYSNYLSPCNFRATIRNQLSHRLNSKKL